MLYFFLLISLFLFLFGPLSHLDEMCYRTSVMQYSKNYLSTVTVIQSSSLFNISTAGGQQHP